MKKYWRSLKRHPGVPIAAWLMILGFIAGVTDEDGVAGGFFGMAVMSVFWLPVLWTAWDMRNDA